tara:strand:+ start:33933 stop:34352 length:420 start_codon:yes stop_codon:yes gene_type:complete
MEEAEIAVQNILRNLSKQEIRTSEQIRQKNYIIINDIFEDFLCYPKNIENKKEALKIIDNYELINKKDILKGQRILYFKTRHFFDIKPIEGIATSINKSDKLNIKVGSKYLHSDAKYYFKKLTEDDKLKISLIEAVFDS